MLVATGPNQPVVPALPFAGMGRIFFDGQGGCMVSSIGNLNGQSIPTTSSSCVYSVSPDGTGTSEATFPGTPIADPIPIAFVITDGGDEFRALLTKFIVGRSQPGDSSVAKDASRSAGVPYSPVGSRFMASS